MLKFIQYQLFIIILFISLNAYYSQINTFGSKVDNGYLLEFANEYIKKYERQIINNNKQVIKRKLGEVRFNDTALSNGINFVMNLIDDSINKNSDDLQEIFSKNNSFDNHIINYINHVDFYSEIGNYSTIEEFISTNKKYQQKERLLQLFQNNTNETKLHNQQRDFSNINRNSENNNNIYPIPMNYYGIRGNPLVQSQQNIIRQPSLSGLFSITNPAFKMIVSTVLMCLGSTPYGAIAVLVVVTVYTLVEIVIKYFYSKTKNKNILNSLKRSSKMNITANSSKNTYNMTSNSTVIVDRSQNNKLLRNLMKHDNDMIPIGNLNQIYGTILQNNYEQSQQERNLEFFSSQLIEYINRIKELNNNKIGLINDIMTKNMTSWFMNSLLDFFTNNSTNELEQAINVTSNKKFDEILYLTYRNYSSYDILPDWYKNICIICISMKENRILHEGGNDSWVPIDFIMEPKHDFLFELNNRISEIDGFINIEAESESKPVLNNSNISSNNHNFPVKIDKSEHLISDRAGYLSHNNTNHRWYDNLIKYSIQSYRQNGVRGVITMILDIFSTIFSATPVGYLLITLIRLIAFMTDKLLLLSRRRKNQDQLSRLLFEIPEIFNEEKLYIVLKEIGLIEAECNREKDILIKLYTNYIKHLQIFNPSIDISIVSREIDKFAHIIERQHKFVVGHLNSYYNFEPTYSNIFRKLVYQKKSNGNNNSEGWTLNKNNEIAYNYATEKKANDYNEKNIEVTSTVIKETKYIESKDNSNIVKNSFQNMIGGLKSFLLNLFKSIFGGAGELWEYIKGLLSRIIDFIKTLWEVIRGEKKKRILIEILENFPADSAIQSCISNEIINILQVE
ncbi:putative signal peptide-containing and transmembrane domain-containing protein [Cryptosporidium canis]|uniref:Signal peptide-containing and transmembrane domain-containing protein n=1 Tax=Cryptosporidium canis TaxID=195482 RepID=A0A9D5DJG3_9CRYT|nr:putative signal peptide-containing and transmembrane domain-containing protein [Cryptosporidium canis]